MTYVLNASNAVLNANIVPIALQSMTQAQQCRQICSNAALRRQITDFFGSICSYAKIQNAAKKAAPLHVPWKTGRYKYVISPRQLHSFSFYLTINRTGFAYLLHKALEYERKDRVIMSIRSRGGKVGSIGLCP